MSIDIRELERLHSIVLEPPSVRGALRAILGGASPWDQFCAYALDNFPEILSALRDKEALEQRAKRAEMAMAVFWNRTGPHQGSTWIPTQLLQTWIDEADALLRDKERLDKLARIRIVDGIGGIDIDEMTAEAIAAIDGADDSEERWAQEWAAQFRAAIDALPEENL